MKPMTRYLSFWLLLAVLLLPWQSGFARELPDFTVLVEQAAPGVVNISTTRTVPGRAQTFEDFGQDVPDIFRHFFGDRFPAPLAAAPGEGWSVSRWAPASSSATTATFSPTPMWWRGPTKFWYAWPIAVSSRPS